MSRGPKLLWWMPRIFGVEQDDTELMNDRQSRIYGEILQAAWRKGFELPVDALPTMLRCSEAEIREIFMLAPGLSVVSGSVRHRQYEREYARYRKASDQATAAAKKRWRHLKLVSDSEDS